MTLRIGIDCRPLSKPLSGIGRYTYELLSRLIAQHDAHWYLYTHQPLKYSFSQHSNVTVRESKSALAMGELFWFHIQLPKLIINDNIDTYWSPRHHLPYLLNKKINTILTIHDLTWARLPQTMKLINYWSERLQMPYSIKRADQIITISNSSKHDITNFFPNCHKKTRVIHCGVSTFDSISTIKNLPADYLLFVGTPEPRKNLPRLLIAYDKLPSALKKRYPLVLIGGYGWKTSTKELVGKLESAEHIIILGSISNEELAYAYSKAKLLLMPSLYEGFGLPILEAFQFGIPAIVSNTSSMPEVLGKGGLTVDPLCTEDITDAITRILTDHELYLQCSENTAIELQKFGWEKSSQEIWQLIKESKKQKPSPNQ